MARDVDADHLFLAREFLIGSPVGQRGQWLIVMLRLIGDHAEEANLAAHSILPNPLAGLDGTVDHRRELGAVAGQRVHCTVLDQGLHHATVHRAHVDALAEFV